MAVHGDTERALGDLAKRFRSGRMSRRELIQGAGLLNGLLTGLLVYVAFIFLVELTQMHVLLFLCGPVITLAVFRFAPL